jgi:hypothetical protein
MVAVLGAMFLVGTALCFFISSMTCRKADMSTAPRYGAMWAALPAAVYAVTDSGYAMMAATWIPTMVLIYATEFTVCKKNALLK